MNTGGRASHRLSQGLQKANVIDHGYYLKPMTMNPYVGTVHDGTTTAYNQGFVKKHMHWLQRFRYNLLPLAKTTGMYSVNKMGKHVHYLEVSTIEKMRIKMVSEEFRPMYQLMIIVVVFSLWQFHRLVHHHPDLSYYNFVMWTTKPWVTQYRFTKKHRIDEPAYRYMIRCPEYYQEDPYRDLLDLGVIANDPYIEYCKAHGTEKDLHERKWGAQGKRPPQMLPITDLPKETDSVQSHRPKALIGNRVA